MTENNKETAQKFSQNPHQEVVISLMLVSQRVRAKLEALCESENITLSQFNILRILKGIYPGAHPRSEIRKRMIDKSDVTRLIDRLETRGLVKRISAEKDKRHSLTMISAEGIEILERLNEKFPLAHHEILRNFTDTELIEMMQLLQKVA